MRKQNRRKNRIAWAKRSALGRTMCRLLGDEAGGVMMEYVILGLLVAAAVVVAVMYFGRNIMLGFNAMGAATAGESEKSAQVVQKSKQTATEGAQQSEAHHRKISDK